MSEVQRIDQFGGLLSPAGQAAYQEFARAMSNQRTQRDGAIGEAMEGMQELAKGFALAMIQHAMPVDRAFEDVHVEPPSYENDWEPELVAKRSQPVWLVVRNTDLSNRQIRSAEILTEVAHHSILSGSYSGSHTERKPVDPDTIGTLRLGYNDKLHCLDKVIAVAAWGGLVVLDGGSFGKDKWEAQHPTYRIMSTEAQPKDLFDTEGKIKPKQLITAMKTRLEASVQAYTKKLHDERAEGKADRPTDYYITRELSLPVKELPAPRRRRFGRRG